MTSEKISWGARDLEVRYGRDVALRGVDFEVIPGEVRMVVGGDGAGKTTLLRALAGAIRPSGGRVEAPSVNQLGFMPTSAGTWADLTVAENFEFVAAAQGVSGPALRRRRDALLEAAGLENAIDRLSRQLSGGMRQKLAFSLAMLHEPDLLILDEPSTGVDPVSRVELWRLISRAAADGAAVAMATTYVDEAERASHVVVLDDGAVLLAGAPGDLLDAVPGHVTVDDEPGDRGLTWRRGRNYHHWHRHDPQPGSPRVEDLEDAVVAASLAKEVARA